MNWFIIALLPPALWAATNHIDKYLMERYFKNSTMGSLALFSSLIGVIMLPVVLIVHPNVFGISLIDAMVLMLSGGIYIVATLLYLYALQDDEASIVVPLFQTIPVFSYILGRVFLGEQLQQLQIWGGLIILVGSVLLTLEIDLKSKIRFKKSTFILMLLSSLAYAINLFIFKFVSIEGDFWQTSFWEYTGFSLVALSLIIFASKWRKEFFGIFKANTATIVSVNILNEVLSMAGKLLFNFASLLAPLALVSLVNGFQPAFVFLIGVVLTFLFPHIAKESLAKKDLIQKIVSIAIILAGAFLLEK